MVDLYEIKIREEYFLNGLLRKSVSEDGSLVIYTYTDKCTFERKWDNITINSRGHIFNIHSGECIARPFPKFMNLGENNDVLPNILPWGQPYEVYEKMDGWLGILYRQDRKFKVASRGSFSSEGALWATDLISNKDLSFLPDEVTLVFEIINKNQKIVIDYKNFSNLVVLAAFNRKSGEEFPRSIVKKWADRIPLPIVRKIDNMTLSNLLESQEKLEEKEGFVIRFQNGTRIKIKTKWYLSRAKIISNMGPLALWETMKNGKVDSEHLKLIPDDLLPIANDIVSKLEHQHSFLFEKIFNYYKQMTEMFELDRKSIALYMRKEKTDKIVSKNVFSMIDGREEMVHSSIKEYIRPKNNEIVENVF